MIYAGMHWAVAVLSLVLFFFALPTRITAAALPPLSDSLAELGDGPTQTLKHMDSLVSSTYERRDAPNALDVLSSALKTYAHPIVTPIAAQSVAMIGQEIVQAAKKKNEAENKNAQGIPKIKSAADVPISNIGPPQAARTTAHKPKPDVPISNIGPPHAAPTHKHKSASKPKPKPTPKPIAKLPPPSLLSVSFPPEVQVGKQIAAGNNHKSDQIAENSGGMNGMIGNQAALDKLQCSRLIEGQAEGTRSGGGFAFTCKPLYHPCTQCDPKDCCIWSTEQLGYVSCQGKELGVCTV
ncbi:MAG: hypothetical protein M1828_002950 [Chrysothrix sp. TS-e1954]|nr:MAG: hypothetical protein M1828_002950 [Chrysothrix sp. TS-e1954]